MAWDWGAIANAAVSLYAADQAADAAKEGGAQVAQGSADSNALLREFYNRDEARNAPFYNAGVNALNEYQALMGLGGGQPASGQAGGSGAQTMGWRTGQVFPSNSANQAWFGEGGAPSVNQSRYQSDPYYKQAWDQVAAHHQRQFGKGYTEDSNRAALQGHMQAIYGNLTKNAQKQQQTSAPAASTKTPQQLQQDAFAKFRSAPGYQFGLNEGQGRIEASAAARGGLNSGATLKALQRYGNDYADQQGYTPYMNRLAGLFGGAQTAAGQMQQSGQQYGGQMGQNLQTAANARGQSIYDAANARQQGWGNAAYFGGQAYDSWRNG